MITIKIMGMNGYYKGLDFQNKADAYAFAKLVCDKAAELNSLVQYHDTGICFDSKDGEYDQYKLRFVNHEGDDASVAEFVDLHITKRNEVSIDEVLSEES